MHKVRPSTTSYYKACTKYVPVLLRTTKLAQTTSQYYFVLQSLHKLLPSTTSYYKACTKYFPALLRTTKLAQSTSQYYFVLQSSHKLLPSTTSYYKARTKYVSVLLRTTKLAQTTSQYYFVLQACTKYVPVLLRTTKLAQNTSQYYFVLQSLHKVRQKSQFYRSFRRSKLISCEKVAPDLWKSQFYAQFLTFDVCFVRKRWNRHLKIAILRSVFDVRRPFRAKALKSTPQNRNFTLSFWCSTSISCERVEIDTSKSQFYAQFLTFDVHFVRKRWNRHLKIAILRSVFDVRRPFRAKALKSTPQNRNFMLSFWRSTSISCESVEIDTSKSQFYAQFLMFDVHFVRKRWNRHLKIAILCSVFDVRRPFRAKGLRFVAVWRHRPRLKRERKKSERETYSEKEKRYADM